MSVVMPFAGSPEAAADAIRSLQQIATISGDELILVDNSRIPSGATAAEVRVLRADREHTSYHARNTGAQGAVNDWLLFIDADTVPDPDLIDCYFAVAPQPQTGALAGKVEALTSDRGSLFADYAIARGYLDQADSLTDGFRPHLVTANVLVRKAAWTSIGGFAEGVRSGGDTDFSWRLQEAGWGLELRPDARVHHHQREDARAFLRVVARYAASRAWLRRRWPGSFPGKPGLAGVPRGIVASIRWLVMGDLRRSAFRAIDAAVTATDILGEQLANQPAPADGVGHRSPPQLIVLADAYPVLSETFVVEEIRALLRLGHTVAVEAGRRPLVQSLEALGLVPVTYAEDDSRLRKVAAALWLIRTAPRECLADLSDRRRWRREETVLPLRELAPVARRLAAAPDAVLHCHFAATQALTTMRVARLLGRSYAVTAHAYEIFRQPMNLVEKLETAEVVFTGCDYNVRHLQSLVRPDRRHRVHEIVMGVDPDMWTRTGPLPNGRRVIGVGRLVEKKGFGDLITAISGVPDAELVLIGGGPLRDELTEQARTLGVNVRFTGPLGPADVRAELERADVIAMPCVIAADGDRDSMPVVVKEALALELIVAASDEVGLPELVRPPWGRLVTPGSPDQLAQALRDLLALAADDRAAAGAAGRKYVIEHCNVDRETAKLAALLGLRERASGT